MAEQVAGSDTSPISSRLAEASNVLVLAPSFLSDASGICMDLLAGTDPSRSVVLGITYRETPSEWIDDWQASVGAAPANGLVIGVGDRAGTDVAETIDESAWRIEALEQAGDLTGLGIELSEFLSGAGDATAEQIDGKRLCFDSLTALLQFADLKRTFQFLHVVTGRVKTADAVGHYHLDPEAHDRQTLATIKGLFDAVVEVDESGDVTVQTR